MMLRPNLRIIFNKVSVGKGKGSKFGESCFRLRVFPRNEKIFE